MPPTTPVPQTLTRRLWLALAAIVAFLALSTIQGLLRPGYDSWHQAVSALSLGPSGVVQQVGFVVAGLAMLSSVPAWRRLLAGGTGRVSYPMLIAATAVSFMIAGVVRQDPAPGYDPEALGLELPTRSGLIHLAAAGVAALSSVAGLFVMRRRFRDDPAWRDWPQYSLIAALATIGCVVVYAFWSVRPSGFAGTFERLAIIIPTVWTYYFLRRLWVGAPFMIARGEVELAEREPVDAM